MTTTNDNLMGRTEARHGQIKGAIIRRGARVGGGVVILPGIEIGAEAFVAAGALVTRDVPPAKLVAGLPAHVWRDVPAEEMVDADGAWPPPARWPRRTARSSRGTRAWRGRGGWTSSCRAGGGCG